MHNVADKHSSIKNTFSSVEENETITIKHESSEYKLAKVQKILSDFQKLDFTKNPCSDPLDIINYNEGKEANPFDKIAKYYGRNKNVFLFIAVLRDTEQSKKVINIIEKCDTKAKEKFIERMNTYLGRISQGEDDARELLKSNDFSGAFFNGNHVGPNRNIHENLNINITKPVKPLEISSLFNSRVKGKEEEKSETKRIKIYSNGKRIITINKNEKQQRNYSFTRHAACNIVVSWAAKDESKKDLNCTIVLSINSNEVNIAELTIDGKNAEPKEILELAKQNEKVFIEKKALYEVLEKYCAKLSSQEKSSSESMVPSSSLSHINVEKQKTNLQIS